MVCSKGVHGSGQICIWDCRLLSGVLLMTSRFWKYAFDNSQIEVICVNLESVAFKKYADSANFCSKGVQGSGQICIWGWRLLSGCIVDEEYILKIYIWQLLKLRSFASIWILFFRNMLAQPIFAQSVCMGVDRYAFEVEGYCRVYYWWGVDFENIHLATLKLRSFASIWKLLFKNMLTQSIFAQRVSMGVDRYAFEVEGCSPLYCWRGVHFEYIHLATLKLRSFASIWNLFFKNMLTQLIFAQRVCMGVDRYAFEVEGYCLVYCWWGVDFENIHLETLELSSFASIWNLFFKNMLTQLIFAQRVCMGVDRYAFEVEGYCLVYCWWGVDFENMHLTTLKLR